MQTVPVTPPLRGKKRLRPPTLVVLHATAGASAESSIEHLRIRKLSYHAIIERDGKVFKCLPYSLAALHAGVSTGPDGDDVNTYSVGICFANRNDGKEKVTKAQLDAAAELIAALKGQFPSLKYLATHHGVAPTRKTDPRGVDPKEFAERVDLEPWKAVGAYWLT